MAKKTIAFDIDDQLNHCLVVAEAGWTATMFGDYAWNGAKVLPPGVMRVKDWSAVEKFFDEQS